MNKYLYVWRKFVHECIFKGLQERYPIHSKKDLIRGLVPSKEDDADCEKPWMTSEGRFLFGGGQGGREGERESLE